MLDDLLLDVAAGRYRRLMISMPPRHGKSETCSHWFPAWLLGHWPEKRVILASYEASFAASWGRKVRDTIAEAHALGLWRTQVRGDVSAADNWSLAGTGGGMRTAGVGGAITGYGADVLIVDDPIKNAEEAASPTYRERAWDWWRATAYPRLEPGGVAVLIQTRWGTDDLAGRLLEQEPGEWHVVSLPAIAEEGDALGRAPGEALWPERYPVETLDNIRRTVGSYWWAALYQQSPIVRGESLLRVEKLQVIDALGLGAQVRARVRAWDLAGTADAGDWSAGVRMALLADGTAVIEDVQRFRKSPLETRQTVALTAALDGKDVPIVIEQEPGQAGADQIESYKRDVLAGHRVHAVRATTQKVLRADPLAAAIEAGQMAVVRAGWTPEFVAEAAAFPHGGHDDQIDAAAMAYQFLAAAASRHLSASSIRRGAAPAPRAYGG